jgi:hypothetical protein
MARSSRDTDWAPLLADFRRSGLTHVAFCRTRRISIHAFRHWLYRLRPTAPAPASVPVAPATTTVNASSAHFLPVHIRPEPHGVTNPHAPTQDPATLELVLGEHRRVRVPVGFDPATLRQLLDVLELRP